LRRLACSPFLSSVGVLAGTETTITTADRFVSLRCEGP
jgi:hypothetical protein